MTAAAIAPPAPRPSGVRARPAGPVLGTAIDAVLIGLGSVAVALVFGLRPSWGASANVATTASWLVWIANYPHFAATNYRLYHRRSNLAQYPATALAVPVIVTAGMAGALASPAVIAPAFVLVYQLWSPYHFSGQTVGVTMVYARRLEFPVTSRMRWALGAFVFATFGYQIARFAASTSDFTFYGVTAPALGVPHWVVWAAERWMWLTAALAGAAGAHAALTARRMIPLLVIVPPAAQFVWFAAAPAGLFYYLVPFFHSVQYLLMAWAVETSEQRGRPRLALTARWFAINVALGVALFWVLPRAATLSGRSLASCTAVVFAGVQLHHFFVDGVIWRLRHASVARQLTGTRS